MVMITIYFLISRISIVQTEGRDAPMTPAILIVVRFTSGSAWAPSVSMQSMPAPQACTSTMKTVAETILGAAKSNVNSEVIIENNNAG